VLVQQSTSSTTSHLTVLSSLPNNAQIVEKQFVLFLDNYVTQKTKTIEKHSSVRFASTKTFQN